MSSVRDKILQRKAPVVKLSLKDGFEIEIRLLSYAETQRLSKKLRDAKTEEDAINAWFDWIMGSIVDEHGEPALREDDRDAFKQKDMPFILELGAACVKANTINPSDAEKNS